MANNFNPKTGGRFGGISLREQGMLNKGLVVDIKKTGELSKHLPDLQQQADGRGIDLQKVGIRDLRVPFKVYTPYSTVQEAIPTIANVSVYVNLTKETRGINMSRIPLLLYRYLDKVGSEALRNFVNDLKAEMGCENVYVKAKFPYAVGKKSPGSQLLGVEVYDCILEVKLENGKIQYYLTVTVQGIATCPCSKELGLDSERTGGSRGAPHMQRTFIKVTIEYEVDAPVWIENLIHIIEDTIVTVPYPVVKRIDEQAIALRTWDNPRFVEDIARDIALVLDCREDPVFLSKVLDYVIVVENEETIHTHNVIAIKYKGVENGLR